MSWLKKGDIIRDHAGTPMVRLTKMLGQGGCGVAWKAVFLGENHALPAGASVAVKFATNMAHGVLLEAEGKLGQRLTNPHIMRCFHSFRDADKRLYLINEFGWEGDLRNVVVEYMETKRERMADAIDGLFGLLLEFVGGYFTGDVHVLTQKILQEISELPEHIWERVRPDIDRIEDFVNTPTLIHAERLLQALNTHFPCLYSNRSDPRWTTLEKTKLWPLLFQILNGLNYLHERGVTHRDIKPENLFIAGVGSQKVLIGDFGTAYIGRPGEMARVDSGGILPIGTIAYLAPETCRGLVGPKTDIWALGVTMHELALGRHPFVPNTASRRLNPVELYNRIVECRGLYSLTKLRELGIVRHLSKAMCSVIDAMLIVDPDKRPFAKNLLSAPEFGLMLLERWEHDLVKAAGGKIENPAFLYSYLQKYHGLSLPKGWNFDHPRTLQALQAQFFQKRRAAKAAQQVELDGVQPRAAAAAAPPRDTSPQRRHAQQQPWRGMALHDSHEASHPQNDGVSNSSGSGPIG